MRLALTSLVIPFLVCSFLAFQAGLFRSEHSECLRWQVESQEYSARWFSTSWQKDQCKQFGISFSK